MPKLSEEQVANFQRDGFLIVKAADFWGENADQICKDIQTACIEMDSWPETPGKWMKYFEKSKVDDSRILQRIEYFLEHEPNLAALFSNGSVVADACTQLFGEPAVVYKEKVNFKHPGGGGFNPHQDHAAGWWNHGHTLHISVLVGVDAQTEANGRLEVVAGMHREGLFGKEFEEVPQDKVDAFTWIPVNVQLGDVVFFDSFVPHRSGPNTTDRPRMAMYLTYNRASEGDARQRYYEDKRKSFPPDCERDPSKKYEYKV